MFVNVKSVVDIFGCILPVTCFECPAEDCGEVDVADIAGTNSQSVAVGCNDHLTLQLLSWLELKFCGKFSLFPDVLEGLTLALQFLTFTAVSKESYFKFGYSLHVLNNFDFFDCLVFDLLCKVFTSFTTYELLILLVVSGGVVWLLCIYIDLLWIGR